MSNDHMSQTWRRPLTSVFASKTVFPHIASKPRPERTPMMCETSPSSSSDVAVYPSATATGKSKATPQGGGSRQGRRAATISGSSTAAKLRVIGVFPWRASNGNCGLTGMCSVPCWTMRSPREQGRALPSENPRAGHLCLLPIVQRLWCSNCGCG